MISQELVQMAGHKYSREDKSFVLRANLNNVLVEIRLLAAMTRSTIISYEGEKDLFRNSLRSELVFNKGEYIP